ncbi:MAG: primosomal protein N' [Calditrichaeota bacterium]|nr:MAG: primosomal protein N' [Calditrichota bacterium]MBL1207473.1 primosomal protein N' [Calditrichota bacterium]NOG47305.1 primosomal protein N' [Calditrichota bacterium]
MTFAEVVFNLPLNHSFTYKIPPQFIGVVAGCRVYVPFGKRVMTGVVVDLKDKSSFKSVKDIIDVLDEKPLLKPDILQLTKWISSYYMSSWGQAIQLALPKGLDEFEKENIFLVEENADIDLSEQQQRLYYLIADNPGKSKTFYRKKFGTGSFYTIVNSLHEKGLIFFETEKQKARVGVLMRHYVVIPQNYDEIKLTNEKFCKYLEKRPEVDKLISENSGTSILLSDFQKQTRMAHATIQKMHHNGIVSIEQLATERKPEINYNEKKENFTLNNEQTSVINEIVRQSELDQFKSFLLHGITGSGKTVVYIEILKKVVEQGKSAIILIPEIALTPQTVSRFKAVFGDKIAVFHSKMSIGQRYDAWMACYSGQVKIAIGPRSALFAPMDNIGLIVVDEEHEQSYKQTETAPLYNARDVSLYWGRQHNAVVVLGSATPSFETYYNAHQKKHTLLKIENRATSGFLPEVVLADMRKEKSSSKNRAVFSKILLEKIEDRLNKKEQIILLQNRRGFSSFQQCLHCGFIPKCSECEVTLTYHTYDNKLRCHYCGLNIPAAKNCANCGSDELDNKGIGTQQIQEELANRFKNAVVLRMDQDTTRAKNAYDQILGTFREGKADILLGTQMISKGLDFPNVTLVGVISADVGLSIPDFRSSEKIFQLLSQVAGRAGRGDKPGEVVIQSYQVQHYAIQFAKNHDYSGFFNEEIKHRETYKYPPFNRMIIITVSASNISDAISKAREISTPIRIHGKYLCDLTGPAPAAISKIKNLYRWQISLKINKKYDPAGVKTRQLLSDVLSPFTKQKSNSLFINIDVDPVFGG